MPNNLVKTKENIENLIYEVRGKQVMIDSDLALLYEVETKQLNRQVKRNIESNIVLRDYQSPCLNALKTYVNGLFILPCGLGKTECALACASYLKQHTLFIAHTNDLVNQAKERCLEKMNCSVCKLYLNKS